jgi:hypothetical protein
MTAARIDPREQFEREREAASRLKHEGGRALFVWEPQPAIVVTAREAARRFAPRDQASRIPSPARSSGRGDSTRWPLVVRDTGGAPVAVGPGMLCVSELHPLDEPLRIEPEYGRFCARLANALRDAGVACSVGTRPGSFCDGRFNLLAGGRKLAGTALRVYGVGAGRVLLSHAIVAAGFGAYACVAALNRWLDGHAMPLVDAAAVVTVEELAGRVAAATLRETMERSFAGAPGRIAEEVAA